MRQFKKTLKCLGLTIAGLLALALIVNAYFVWQTGKRLEERLSKVRAAGEPLSLAELGTAPVQPGKNAADVLTDIKPELKALIKEINPVLAKATADEPRPDPIPDADRQILEQAFANHPSVLPALKEAADCPIYQSQCNFQASTDAFNQELLSWTLNLREAINALDTQERLQLQRKDFDGAMRTCLVSLKLTRRCDGEPMIISHLVILAVRSVGVRMANEILRAGPVAPELHQQLDDELAKHDSAASFRRCLVSERAYGLQALGEQLPGGWLTRAFVNDNKIYYMDLMTGWIENADGPYAQFKEQNQPVKEEDASFRYVMMKLLAPAVMKIQDAEFRTRCMVRCLRVLNALTAKKIQTIPDKLTNLGLSAEAVTDPYTGQPLMVKKVDGQWVIYGTGPNLKDDGGNFEKLEDIGLGPAKK